jgi:hypothetical protein
MQIRGGIAKSPKLRSGFGFLLYSTSLLSRLDADILRSIILSLAVPEEPGLGVEINGEILSRVE